MKIRIQREPERESNVPEHSGRNQGSAPHIPPQAPTREFLESIWGNIARHNIKIMSDGRQWVIHCLTGDVLERHLATPVQDGRGSVMWIRKGEKLSPLDQPTSHKWRNPE